MLSGFVLDHAYAARLRGGMGVAAFAVVRLIRLYPLYLVASLITLGLALVPAWPGHYHPPLPSLRTVVLAALFVPTIAPAEPHIGLYPLVGPAWSLFFELAVNVGFALVATRLDARGLTLVLLGGAAVLVATVAHFGTIDVGYTQASVLGGFGRVTFAFFAGVAAHRLWQADALPWLRLPAWAAALAVAAMFHVAPANAARSDTALVLVAMPALVLASARAEPPPWLARPFAVLGLASYGLYVLTNPVDQWFETLTPWARVNGYLGIGSAGAVLLVSVTLTLALALDRWFDVPVRRWLTRRFHASVRRDYHSAATPLR